MVQKQSGTRDASRRHNGRKHELTGVLPGTGCFDQPTIQYGRRWYRTKAEHVMPPAGPTAVSTIYLGCCLAQAALITPQPTYLVPAFLFAFLLFVTPLPALIAHASGGGPSAHPDNRRSRSSAGEALT